MAAIIVGVRQKDPRPLLPKGTSQGAEKEPLEIPRATIFRPFCGGGNRGSLLAVHLRGGRTAREIDLRIEEGLSWRADSSDLRARLPWFPWFPTASAMTDNCGYFLRGTSTAHVP